MNKGQFIAYIAETNDCTNAEAKKVIDMFTSSVIDAISKGNDISLIGFGHFSVSNIRARDGRNPKTGDLIQIAAYNQPKFKIGQKLKNAANT